jgi:hypothetical protein
MSPSVVVVGAGAAGIVASWRAASLGVPVVLLEKTSRIGTKILISGGGKCNITHDGPLEDVLRAFRKREAQFIRPACYRFPPSAMVKLLTDRGLRVYTRDDGRIFPVEQTAKDVVAILHSLLREVDVQICLDEAVQAIGEDGAGLRVTTAKRFLTSNAVVVTTGGSSYPNSGTTGDGFGWARQLGHTIVAVRAALAPIYLDLQNLKPERSGLALRNCILRAKVNSKEVARWQGDLLFTHHGISGPNALGISREVVESMTADGVSLHIDFCPHLTFEQLSEQIQTYGKEHPRKQISSWVELMLPQRLVPDFLESLEIRSTVPMSRFDKRSRNRLSNGLKDWLIGDVRVVPLEKGEVVAGGVSTDEVDPHTMKSKIVPGLFLAGEVLDIAGPVGGYNLQAAWATGFVAGEHAANAILSR